MKLWAIVLAVSAVLATGHKLLAQDDYLTEGEVEAVRDTGQEPEKRLTVYLTFAQRRLDTVRSALTSEKTGSGEAVQGNLSEYNHILQAMEDTIDDARENREPIGKGLQQVTTRGKEFLKYLETIQPESASASKDYQFALEEALAMTREELDVAGKGEYPEVRQRKPPSDLPASPPPTPPKDKSGSDDQGPPRKSSNQH